MRAGASVWKEVVGATLVANTKHCTPNAVDVVLADFSFEHSLVLRENGINAVLEVSQCHVIAIKALTREDDKTSFNHDCNSCVLSDRCRRTAMCTAQLRRNKDTA